MPIELQEKLRGVVLLGDSEDSSRYNKEKLEKLSAGTRRLSV